MTTKRKYQKKNQEYWNSMASRKPMLEDLPQSQPELLGEPFYISNASYSRSGDGENNRSVRSNTIARTQIPDRYSNIKNLEVPFYYGREGIVNIKDPILLCQKAYFHIPIYKNTVDIMSELSNSELVVTGGTRAARSFVKKWLESIKIETLKNQFFREYYRSGNVFLYRMFADFSESEINAMKTIYAKNTELIPTQSDFPKNSLPMKYIILNPMDIVNYESLGTTPVYKKALTKFEAVRLKNPSSEEEKRILENLKKATNNKILNLEANEIYVDLDPNRTIFCFYKKQDYEPFAIPFGFPILRDLNWKLELKKIDQSVSRSLENIILLITMGTDPDKGGINPRNLEAMKQLFSSEAVGRVLVADYTTKAQFVIPQLDNILSKEKYEIVNQDIKEGLQNIFFEEAKYANSEIKIKIFFEKLKEGKNIFVNDFLQPEVKKICAALGFRETPKVRFRSSNILNETEIQKAAIRLMELGVLVPKQGIDTINNKELPDGSEIEEGQEEYVEQRKEGIYTPLVGGVPLYSPNQTSAPPVSNISTTRGRPSRNSIASTISVKALTEVAKSTTSFEITAMEIMKTQKGINSLDDEQISVVQKICASIIESNDQKDWNDTFVAFASGNIDIDKLKIKDEVFKISEEYNVSTYEAALIYHSKNLK